MLPFLPEVSHARQIMEMCPLYPRSCVAVPWTIDTDTAEFIRQFSGCRIRCWSQRRRLRLWKGPQLCPAQSHPLACPPSWPHRLCFDSQCWPVPPGRRMQGPLLSGQQASTMIEFKKESLVSSREKWWPPHFCVWVLYRIFKIYSRNDVKRRD